MVSYVYLKRRKLLQRKRRVYISLISLLAFDLVKTTMARFFLSDDDRWPIYHLYVGHAFFVIYPASFFALRWLAASSKQENLLIEVRKSQIPAKCQKW